MEVSLPLSGFMEASWETNPGPEPPFTTTLSAAGAAPECKQGHVCVLLFPVCVCVFIYITLLLSAKGLLIILSWGSRLPGERGWLACGYCLSLPPPTSLCTHKVTTHTHCAHWVGEIRFTCSPQAAWGHPVLYFKGDRVAAEPAEALWKQPVMWDFPVQCPVMSRSGRGSAPRAQPAERLAGLELVHLLLRPCRIIGNEGSSSPANQLCSHHSPPLPRSRRGPSPGKLCLPTPLLDSL